MLKSGFFQKTPCETDEIELYFNKRCFTSTEHKSCPTLIRWGEVMERETETKWTGAVLRLAIQPAAGGMFLFGDLGRDSLRGPDRRQRGGRIEELSVRLSDRRAGAGNFRFRSVHPGAGVSLGTGVVVFLRLFCRGGGFAAAADSSLRLSSCLRGELSDGRLRRTGRLAGGRLFRPAVPADDSLLFSSGAAVFPVRRRAAGGVPW